MDPRARVVAVVSAVLLVIGGGYAIGTSGGDQTTEQSSQARPGNAPGPEFGSASGAADEYELSPAIKRAKPDG